ncbi:hypothetical protein ED312_05615 [Sinomicrobium pectinilyticum]|uniref:Uncharacterized protein n=2 Tax=Sinomicrobium pectinilyticum TaxID=1084421 RepID=A0A3N0ESA5_SINP1|nr:hypothetical protein ED312_05615 [Sinomicrobium pectinilyticum]
MFTSNDKTLFFNSVIQRTVVMRSPFSMLRGWPVVLLLFFACQQQKEVPDIYVDQVLETLNEEGGNMIKEQYVNAVEICESSDKKVRGLSEADMDKLGTRRYQLAITPEKIVIRQESWGFRMTGHHVNPGECRFVLVHQGDLTIKIPGRTMVYDLKENTLTEEEQGIPEAFDLPFQALSETGEEQDTSGVHSVRREFMGQPVVQWVHNENNIETLWAGGREWGFSEMPSENMFAVPGKMVLQKEQKKEGYVLKLNTRTFTVGIPVDFGTFAIPAEVLPVP